jgi:nucleotide-binding universal stress UspA family protein
VPLDGSETARRALPVAEALARSVDVPVHCLAVAEPAEEGGREGGKPTAADASRAEERVHAAAAALRAAGIVAAAEVRAGSARVEVVAALRPGDLVVMTTHGNGRAARWSIGTVAERVLHRSPGPVLLIRADAGQG